MKKPERLVWIDSVRGFSVTGVVLLHFVIYAYMPFVENMSYKEFWRELVNAIAPFRLPALFFVSGLLMSSRLRKGWSSRRTRRSVLSSSYLYVMWMLVYAIIGTVGVSTAVPAFTGWKSLVDFATSLAFPQTTLWFILALAFWAALVATLHKLPPAVVVTTAVVIAASTSLMPGVDGVDQYLRVLRYGLYFVLAVYARETVAVLSKERPAWIIPCAAVIYAMTTTALETVTARTLAFELLTMSRYIAAIVLTISVMILVTRLIPAATAPLAWVGQRTLPIYVLHGPLIWLLAALPIWPEILLMKYHSAIAPILWTTIITTLCIAIRKATARTPLRFAFEMPRGTRESRSGRSIRSAVETTDPASS